MPPPARASSDSLPNTPAANLHSSSPECVAVRRFSFYSPRFLRLLSVQATFSFGWSLYLVAPKFYSVELNATAHTLGLISAAGGFGAVVMIPVVARGIDSVGRKPFLVAGMVLLGLSSLGYVAVDDVGPLVFLVHAGTGAAFILTSNATTSLVTDVCPPRRLAHAFGVLGAANMAMNAVASWLAEHLADAGGWTSVFVLGAIAGSIGLAQAVTTPDSMVQNALVQGASHRPRLAHPNALLWRRITIPLVSTTAVGAAFVAVFSFHQPFAIELGATHVRPFFTGFAVSALIARIAFGNIGDRLGRHAVSCFFIAIYAVSAALMSFMRIEWLLGYGALFGLAHGILYPTLNALVVERVPPFARGRAITLYNGAFYVGAAAGGLAWGEVGEAFGFPAVLAGASLVSLLGGLLLLWRRR